MKVSVSWCGLDFFSKLDCVINLLFRKVLKIISCVINALFVRCLSTFELVEFGLVSLQVIQGLTHLGSFDIRVDPRLSLLELARALVRLNIFLRGCVEVRCRSFLDTHDGIVLELLRLGLFLLLRDRLSSWF